MINRPLTDNQIKSLHPVVRAEYKNQRLTDAEAKVANRLIRDPYRFKSRIALRAVREKLNNAEIASLKGVLRAMPSDAPAELLENASFAVLRKERSLEGAVLETEQAAEIFRKKRNTRGKS